MWLSLLGGGPVDTALLSAMRSALSTAAGAMAFSGSGTSRFVVLGDFPEHWPGDPGIDFILAGIGMASTTPPLETNGSTSNTVCWGQGT